MRFHATLRPPEFVLDPLRRQAHVAASRFSGQYALLALTLELTPRFMMMARRYRDDYL